MTITANRPTSILILPAFLEPSFLSDGDLYGQSSQAGIFKIFKKAEAVCVICDKLNREGDLSIMIKNGSREDVRCAFTDKYSSVQEFDIPFGVDMLTLSYFDRQLTLSYTEKEYEYDDTYSAPQPPINEKIWEQEDITAKKQPEQTKEYKNKHLEPLCRAFDDIFREIKQKHDGQTQDIELMNERCSVIRSMVQPYIDSETENSLLADSLLCIAGEILDEMICTRQEMADEKTLPHEKE